MANDSDISSVKCLFLNCQSEMKFTEIVYKSGEFGGTYTCEKCENKVEIIFKHRDEYVARSICDDDRKPLTVLERVKFLVNDHLSLKTLLVDYKNIKKESKSNKGEAG